MPTISWTKLFFFNFLPNTSQDCINCQKRIKQKGFFLTAACCLTMHHNTSTIHPFLALLLSYKLQRQAARINTKPHFYHKPFQFHSVKGSLIKSALHLLGHCPNSDCPPPPHSNRHFGALHLGRKCPQPPSKFIPTKLPQTIHSKSDSVCGVRLQNPAEKVRKSRQQNFATKVQNHKNHKNLVSM